VTRALALAMQIGAGAALACATASAAHAQRCTLDGARVACDDGRSGIFEGDAIRWPDGTRSARAPHPSVIPHNREALRVGPGVFVGNPHGAGTVPFDDPNAPNKRVCAILNDIPYCH
jgi:hypothetical protein